MMALIRAHAGGCEIAKPALRCQFIYQRVSSTRFASALSRNAELAHSRRVNDHAAIGKHDEMPGGGGMFSLAVSSAGSAFFL